MLIAFSNASLTKQSDQHSVRRTDSRRPTTDSTPTAVFVGSGQRRRKSFFQISVPRDAALEQTPQASMRDIAFIVSTSIVRSPKQPGDTHRRYDQMDTDILGWTREQLIAEVVRLRNGVRAHRDSSGHDLCWFHPELWSLLPEPLPKHLAVPAWPQFLRGCIKYREALDRELPNAPRTIVEDNDDVPEKVGE